MAEVTCHECGAPMKLRQTQKYLYPNGCPRNFYGCMRWPECSGVRPAHPDGTVYGIPGDAATKAARQLAHRAFDAWWQGSGRRRQDAYAALRHTLGLSQEEAHISMFSVEQCERLVAIVAADAAGTVVEAAHG